MSTAPHPVRASIVLLAIIGLSLFAVLDIAHIERFGSPIGEPVLTPAISPNGDGERDAMTMRIDVKRRQAVSVSIRDRHDQTVAVLASHQPVHGKVTLHWNGTVLNGTTASDGAYSVQVVLERSGRHIELPQSVLVDTKRPKILHASASLIPNLEVVRVHAQVRGVTNASLTCDGFELDRVRFTRGPGAGSDHATERMMLSSRSPGPSVTKQDCVFTVRDRAWNIEQRRVTVSTAAGGETS